MVKRPTVIFLADLVKSSARSEQLTDDEWSAARGDFARLAHKIIRGIKSCYHEYSGPTEGDSVVAYLMTREDAIRMALDLEGGLSTSKHNLQRKAEGKPSLVTAVAIHYANLPFEENGPEGYPINLTSKILKRASELARRDNTSKILITEGALKPIGQSAPILRRIEAAPLGPMELADLDARPKVWEVCRHESVKRKMPSRPGRVARDEELVREYMAKGHPIHVELQVIDVDIQPDGNAFVTDTRRIRKDGKDDDGEDEIYFGVYDSPDCEVDFTKELFSLVVRDGEGHSLREKWHESAGTIKRFGIYLGRTMGEGETMVVRAMMFIPQLFDLRAKSEYFDLDIWDPTDKAIVRLRFPPGLKTAKKAVFEYKNGHECPGPAEFIAKCDPMENRFVVAYAYIAPRVESTYYCRWKWRRDGAPQVGA